MKKHWLILTERYGEEFDSPSHEQLTKAVRDLYHETASGMTEADFEEHGSASLRYGADDGPVFVVEVFRSKRVTFEQYADQDFEEELAPILKRTSVSETEILQLWTWLSAGEIEKVKATFA